MQPGHFSFNATRGVYCLRPDPNRDDAKCVKESRSASVEVIVPEWARRKLNKFFASSNEEFFAMVGKRFMWD